MHAISQAGRIHPDLAFACHMNNGRDRNRRIQGGTMRADLKKKWPVGRGLLLDRSRGIWRLFASPSPIKACGRRVTC